MINLNVKSRRVKKHGKIETILEFTIYDIQKGI